MKIDAAPEEAREVILSQLRDTAQKLSHVARLFEAREYKEAYRIYPYNESAGGNLETFVSQLP